MEGKEVHSGVSFSGRSTQDSSSRRDYSADSLLTKAEIPRDY